VTDWQDDADRKLTRSVFGADDRVVIERTILDRVALQALRVAAQAQAKLAYSSKEKR
jgi:hypothetical protein